MNESFARVAIKTLTLEVLRIWPRERAAALTSQLLAFSRRQVLQPRVLDLNKLVTSLSTMLRRLIGEDVDLRLVLPPELGTVSADPNVLPLGSKIRVSNAGIYSGEYTVVDTGRKVSGHVIDIYVSSVREARQFGKKQVAVQILKSPAHE